MQTSIYDIKNVTECFENIPVYSSSTVETTNCTDSSSTVETTTSSSLEIIHPFKVNTNSYHIDDIMLTTSIEDSSSTTNNNIDESMFKSIKLTSSDTLDSEDLYNITSTYTIHCYDTSCTSY